MRHKIRLKNLLNSMLCAWVLLAFISCNVNFRPSFKQTITDAQMKDRVSRVIDAQLENIIDCLDEDLQQELRIEGSRGGELISSSEIINRTLKENGGRDYLDFCYAIDYCQSNDVEAVLETAKSVLDAQTYESLCNKAEEVERSIMEKGEETARAIPLNQQAAFYKDLKLLVTRAIVLLTAGIVYACMPNLIFWGKVSAACAVSVGAGLVAISIMSLYEYYRYGQDEQMTFEDWFKGLLEIPKADFALTASITAISEAMGAGPVVTGIIICIFGL